MKTTFTTDELFGLAYLAAFWLMSQKTTEFTDERQIVKRLFDFLRETEDDAEEYTIIANN